LSASRMAYRKSNMSVNTGLFKNILFFSEKTNFTYSKQYMKYHWSLTKFSVNYMVDMSRVVETFKVVVSSMKY